MKLEETFKVMVPGYFVICYGRNVQCSGEKSRSVIQLFCTVENLTLYGVRARKFGYKRPFLKLTRKYMNASRELADYQEECCKKGMNLFVQLFHHLCD